MEQLDLNQILTFVRIAQAGSLTKAADRLRQPKSRLSRKLADLERTLGTPLFFRTTRQIQLTAAGKIYFEKCQSLIEALAGASNELNLSSSEMTGAIKITASDDMGALLLPEIIREYNDLYPKVKFEVVLTQAFLDLVKESIDVGVRIGVLKDSTLRARKLGSVRAIFVAHPNYLERYGKIDFLEDLKQHELLLLTKQPSQNKIEVFKLNDAKKISLPVKIGSTSNNPAFLVQLALQGRGIAYVPEFLAKQYIKSNELVHILRTYHSPQTPIHLVIPEQSEVPLRVQKFMDLAAKKMREMFAN